MSVISSSRRRLLVEAAPETGLEGLERLAAAGRGGLEAMTSSPDEAEADRPTRWFAAEATPGAPAEHPWDEAHRSLDDPAFAGLETAPSYVEPDFVQQFPYAGPDDIALESFTGTGPCRHSGPDPFWPPATAFQFGWHLDDDHSQLRSAREHAGDPGDGRRVRIAILDTGYDPEHQTLPQHFLASLQRNFFDEDNPLDATDPGRHFPQNQPGHGTATMALLAGRRVAVAPHGFDDFFGGAPFAEVVAVRIADSVIHFGTGAMARGIDYARQSGCRVVSISMGGVPARSWADAVNRAYDAGVAIFAAAGNRIGPSPPGSIVYPARFGRVTAVCGVTADKSPYYREGLHRKMQGCFGPDSKMGTALAAYTPNTPWAMMGCTGLVVDDGGGTSSATPQAAAAAALWLQQANIPASAPPWQRVEAVRHTLFSSADKTQPSSRTFFGQGLLRARAALDVGFDPARLKQTPRDSVSFPWLRLAGVLEAAPALSTHDLMFEIEALQVYVQSPDIQRIAGGADPLDDNLDPATRRRLFTEMSSSPLASKRLRDHLAGLARRM